MTLEEKILALALALVLTLVLILATLVHPLHLAPHLVPILVLVIVVPEDPILVHEAVQETAIVVGPAVVRTIALIRELGIVVLYSFVFLLIISGTRTSAV